MFHVERAAKAILQCSKERPRSTEKPKISTESSTGGSLVGGVDWSQAKQLKNKAKTPIFMLQFPDYAARPPGFRRRPLRLQ
jgi:hypothetical protein